MTARDLDAAGITDPDLRASYERCRRLNAVYGRTYYLATRLLPPGKRPSVHALYGFARRADEFVDDPTHPRPQDLVAWGERFLADLAAGDSDDPVGKAAVHTARTWDIPAELFAAFLDSMRLDLTVTGYPSFSALRGYMYGSAGVIGLQMARILEPLDKSAYGYARTLGEAFQLTNFIRDVGEDLARGRVYLPQEDLERFAVTRDDLAAGRVTEQVRGLLRFEIERARGLYDVAAPGIDLLHPTSRECIRTAWHLYRGILDAVERADYQVLTGRVAVPLTTRLRVAVPALARSRRAQARARRTRARA